MLTIISVALPKVTLNNAPIVSPTPTLNSSVAKLSRDASGINEKKFVRKTHSGDHFKVPERIANGNITSNKFK